MQHWLWESRWGCAILEYLGAWEDQKIAFDSGSSAPALCVQKCRHAAVLHPFLAGLLQTTNPVCLSSWMISVSCPDGNTVIQACSWILCCTKPWNDKWSFQEQVQCKSRAATERFVFPCLIALVPYDAFCSPPLLCAVKKWLILSIWSDSCSPPNPQQREAVIFISLSIRIAWRGKKGGLKYKHRKQTTYI